eukprot:m.153396 g.153396  ORF g.153396 m.153396 type:complete len:61 (+) comp17471_c1_seq2:231-413(+)
MLTCVVRVLFVGLLACWFVGLSKRGFYTGVLLRAIQQRSVLVLCWQSLFQPGPCVLSAVC